MYGHNEAFTEYQQMMDQFAVQMSNLDRETLQQLQSVQYEGANAAARERIADAQILADYQLDPILGAQTAAYKARIRAAYRNGVSRGYSSGMSF